MSILDRILRRGRGLPQPERHSMAGTGMSPDTEQQRKNRELMEADMAASRTARGGPDESGSED